MKSILKDGTITRLLTDSGDIGYSGETYLVRHNGDKYVLRSCSDEARAHEYVLMYYMLAGYSFTPALLGCEGKNLLFEYLDGRDCKKEDALEVAYEAGRISGAVSQIPIINNRELNLNSIFSQRLEFLLDKQLITKPDFEAITRRYQELREVTEPVFSMDFGDLIPCNLRLSEGKVYLVDFHAINFDLKGKGIAKAFLKWFKTCEQREKFKQGYQSVESIDFLTHDYLQLAYMYFLVSNTRIKVQKRMTGLEKNLQMLNLMLEDKLA